MPEKSNNVVLRDSIGSTQLAIFAHTNASQIHYSISVTRRYRDASDEWTHTEFLWPQNVGPAIALLMKAQSFLISNGVVEAFPSPEKVDAKAWTGSGLADSKTQDLE